jgi:flagellar basal body-associated protein FliL
VLKKKKILIPIVLLVVMGGVYKTVLAKPAEKPHHKIEGTVYILPKEFLLNMADGRYAKLSVSLVLAHDDPGMAPAGGGHGAAAAPPPEGYGPHPQEAAVRDVVTDTITNEPGDSLIEAERRERLKKKIKKAIKSHTDVHVEDVLFTDVAVQ